MLLFVSVGYFAHWGAGGIAIRGAEEEGRGGVRTIGCHKWQHWLRVMTCILGITLQEIKFAITVTVGAVSTLA